MWLESDRTRSLDISEENLKNQQALVSEEVRVNVLNQPYQLFEWISLWENAFTNWNNAHNGRRATVEPAKNHREETGEWSNGRARTVAKRAEGHFRTNVSLGHNRKRSRSTSRCAQIAAAVANEGTDTRTSKQIKEELRSIGGSLSLFSDADSTTMNATALSEFSTRLFELMSDVAQRPSFPETEVKLALAPFRLKTIRRYQSARNDRFIS